MCNFDWIVVRKGDMLEFVVRSFWGAPTAGTHTAPAARTHICKPAPIRICSFCGICVAKVVFVLVSAIIRIIFASVVVFAGIGIIIVDMIYIVNSVTISGSTLDLCVRGLGASVSRPWVRFKCIQAFCFFAFFQETSLLLPQWLQSKMWMHQLDRGLS